jgi:hypothetical protein
LGERRGEARVGAEAGEGGVEEEQRGIDGGGGVERGGEFGEETGVGAYRRGW